MSPISVPIIPQAGPIPAKFSQKPYTFLCRASRLPNSVSRMARTRSGSVPSTISSTPFLRKSSSRLSAASSSARRPSFLARLESSIIFLIVSPLSTFLSFMAIPNPLSPLTKSGNLFMVRHAPKDPPIVIAIEPGSMKLPITPKPSPEIIP